MGEEFRQYLAAGETIRWTDRPMQGVVFLSRDLLLIPFSIGWCVLGFQERVRNWGDETVSGTFFSVLFVCAGLYLLVGRFALDAYRRSRIYYALTDRRLLILGGMGRANLIVVNLLRAREIRLIKTGGGRGTICFAPKELMPSFFRNTEEQSDEPELFRVKNAEEVYGLLQAARIKSA